MIMKKFETLERLQANATATTAAAAEGDVAEGAAGGPEPAGEDGGLTEEQLMEVFRQTSQFTVKAALEGNDILAGAGPPELLQKQRSALLLRSL